MFRHRGHNLQLNGKTKSNLTLSFHNVNVMDRLGRGRRRGVFGRERGSGWAGEKGVTSFGRPMGCRDCGAYRVGLCKI